ncbi:MAG: hypothetical protein M3N54_04195 [Acidobacteriota bacterium]|nr:hypothetical protein [Acidobacteriota bacterium]
MRPERDRKKKLIVAFHFQFSNRTGWDCGNCRKHGLETRRRCGFLPAEQRGPAVVVWGRGDVQADECPTSLITAESVGWIEEFLVKRRLGIVESLDVAARKVDAFLILRDRMEREQQDGTAQR